MFETALDSDAGKTEVELSRDADEPMGSDVSHWMLAHDWQLCFVGPLLTLNDFHLSIFTNIQLPVVMNVTLRYQGMYKSSNTKQWHFC